MLDLKELHLRIKQSKSKRKDLQSMYKDALKNSKSYQEVLADMQVLKDKKLRIEAAIRADFISEFAQMDSLKDSIEADGQLLTDVALDDYTKGKSIEVVEDSGLTFEPKFKVTLKKKS